MKYPLYVQNISQHSECCTIANFYQQIESSSSWLQYPRDSLTDLTWQTGMYSNGDYVLRVFDSNSVFKLTRHGDMTVFGRMDVGLGWGIILPTSIFTMWLLLLWGLLIW